MNEYVRWKQPSYSLLYFFYVMPKPHFCCVTGLFLIPFANISETCSFVKMRWGIGVSFSVTVVSVLKLFLFLTEVRLEPVSTKYSRLCS